MGFNVDLMGFNVGLMGLNVDLMGLWSDWMENVWNTRYLGDGFFLSYRHCEMMLLPFIVLAWTDKIPFSLNKGC